MRGSGEAYLKAEKVVVETLAEILAAHLADIRMDALLLDDLNLDSDDFSLWFVPSVEKQLGVKIPVDAWNSVFTVADAVRVVEEAASAPT